ncbi:MAG: aminotransferase class V-fold PLP-dependent enzyme [Clostridiales bacterium]|jgi:cysteine desulfurase family protein|nr:aminotransferase class V-fold PLP-dependent enzyme [Clostridiales bacterium]MDR2712545.1 aminotransferase class V-fold PLP-dependent enzyme [Clostridiales bacterium]
MIYFDNSATTLIKPPEVSEAVSFAINNIGNAGRSFYPPVLTANREIYNTRKEVAKLINRNEPLNVAFTSSATESLNLVIGGLIGKEDTVVTTQAEHNSVLRPLYLSGCELSFIKCDDNGKLLIDSSVELLMPPTKFLICTHGSNVTGNITEVQKLYSLCKANGIIMILDISQTFGSIPLDINMADIFCFTGHKGLFGPQGTGGIIVNDNYDFKIVKTGGAGVNSFDTFQSQDMPDIFEAGTLNSHSIYGLQKGVRFINETGIDKIRAKEKQLASMFYEGIKNLERIKIYGDFSTNDRLPIVSLNIDGMTSAELAERLWTGYDIAIRAGSHCAPLLHKRLGTAEMGMVRFSFSYFNTEEEIQKGVLALKEISQSLGC